MNYIHIPKMEFYILPDDSKEIKYHIIKNRGPKPIYVGYDQTPNGKKRVLIIK